MTDFYMAVATVLPLLLLAIVWDSKYLSKLHNRTTAMKWFVLVYGPVAVTYVVCAIALCVAVLGDVWKDATWTRWVIWVGLALAMFTLITRACSDIIEAALTALGIYNRQGTTTAGNAPS
jgi:hypothetical protein